MTKFLIGMATAALWFVLSHAANAEGICRQEPAAKDAAKPAAQSAITAAACRAAFPAPIQK